MSTLEIPSLLQRPTARPITGTVLVQDRRETPRSALCRQLRTHGLAARETESSSKALSLAADPACFLVVASLEPAEPDGLELVRRLRELPHAPSTVVLLDPSTLAQSGPALEAGAFSFLVRPIDPALVVLLARRAWETRLLEAAARSPQGTLTQEQVFGFMSALAEAIDAKSPYTRDHADRVACLARRLARELGLPPGGVEQVHAGALLHDLGKVGIPDAILESPDSLAPEERALMEEHPGKGEKILAPIEGLRALLPIVRSHHENWDGTGYPDRLAGLEIPLAARIVKVADTFDAITSSRPYRSCDLTTEEALAMMEVGRGTLFDPGLLDLFLEMMRREPVHGPAQG